MDKPFRLFIGFLCFLPILIWLNYFGHYFGAFHLFELPFYWLSVVLSGPLLIFLFYKLFTVETLGDRSIFLWSVRFLLTGFIAAPIFWYFFIWQEEEYARFSDEERAAFEEERNEP